MVIRNTYLNHGHVIFFVFSWWIINEFEKCGAIIPTCSNCTIWPNNPGTKFQGTAFRFRKKKNFGSSSRSQHTLEFSHFTLLFCTGRLRKVPKFKTHIKSNCFFLINLLWRSRSFRRRSCLSSTATAKRTLQKKNSHSARAFIHFGAFLFH